MIRKVSQEFHSNKRTKLYDATNLLTPEKQRIQKFEIKSDEKPRKLGFLTPPTTPTKQSATVYIKAKALFQRGCRDTTSNGDCLVGREQEGAVINEFITKTIGTNCSDSLYISGPPGCGKSAQLNLSLKHKSTCFNDDIIIKGNRCKVVEINCMTVVNPNDIFDIIMGKLDGKGDIKQYLSQQHPHQSVLVVLDELDSLLTKSQTILTELFRLSNPISKQDHKTNIIVIGISNSIDLTNNLLHKLTIRPQTINFKPYSFDKIKSIITSKLQGLIEADKENTMENFVPIVNSSAIMLCCKKIASITGDLRKAFDTIIKSIEVLETELQTTTNVQDLDFITAPRVQISHIAKVCNLNYNNSILNSLNNLQKTLLINMFNFDIDTHKILNINNFQDYFNSHNENKIKTPEMVEILSNLDSLGVIHMIHNKVMGLKVIRNNVSYNDLKKSIEANEFLRRKLK